MSEHQPANEGIETAAQEPETRNPIPESRPTPESRLVRQLQAQLDQVRDQVAAAEAQRDEAQHHMQAMESRVAAERMLAQAGVVDLEAAYLLLTKRVNIEDQPDQSALASGIEQLLIDKPFLRAAGKAAVPTKTASPRQQPGALAAHLAQAAQRAIKSGGRRDVAEYLRLRRQASLARDGRRR